MYIVVRIHNPYNSIGQIEEFISAHPNKEEAETQLEKHLAELEKIKDKPTTISKIVRR
jgi:hypothetical protein